MKIDIRFSLNFEFIKKLLFTVKNTNYCINLVIKSKINFFFGKTCFEFFILKINERQFKN